ncbi:MAG: aquaporin [Ignavibacteriae bacterium]|nr:aquaporin [Ignavibacteriota bacterium]
MTDFRKYIAEAVGTFALVFCGTGAIIINETTGGAVTHVGIAITFGLVIQTMIFAFGDISGAHINPAVTIAFWISGRFPTNQLVGYIGAQLAGAIVASGLLRLMFPSSESLSITLPAGSEMQSFVLEVVMTFLLMTVIFSVSTGSKEKGVLAAIAIGGVILMEAMFGGPISGASMNPTRSLAPALVSGMFDHLWLYLVAPTGGAILAALFWNFIQPKS